MEIYEIFIWFVLWLFSSLFIFYLTEKVKYIKENKIVFLKLSIILRQLYNTLIRFKSSCSQYIEINKNYSLKEIWSIWFPNYEFPKIIDLYPNIIYEKNNYELFKSFEQVENIIFSLNSLMSDLMINEIKDDLLSWKISVEETEKRYKDELKFIESTYFQLDSYINLVFNLWIIINLINKNNTKEFLCNLKINFSKEEIQEERELLNKYLSNNKKIEDYKITN